MNERRFITSTGRLFGIRGRDPKALLRPRLRALRRFNSCARLFCSLVTLSSTTNPQRFVCKFFRQVQNRGEILMRLIKPVDNEEINSGHDVMREQSIDLSVWIITCEHCEQSFGSCTQNLGMYVHLFLQGSPPLFAFPPAPIVYRYLRPWRLLVNLSRETQQTQIDWATQAPEVMQHVEIVFCKHENILSVELQLRRHVRTGRCSWRSVLRHAQPQKEKIMHTKAELPRASLTGSEYREWWSREAVSTGAAAGDTFLASWCGGRTKDDVKTWHDESEVSVRTIRVCIQGFVLHVWLESDWWRLPCQAAHKRIVSDVGESRVRVLTHPAIDGRPASIPRSSPHPRSL